MFNGRSFDRLNRRIKHVWCSHAYHCCSAAGVHVFFTYVAGSTMANEDEAFVDVVEIGETKPKKPRVLNENNAKERQGNGMKKKRIF